MTFVEMANLTWPEAAEVGLEPAVGLIPTGALEQHGPHLPLITDSLIAEHVAKTVAERIENPVVVAPVVTVGLSSHHLAFPGTATLPEEAFTAQVLGLIEALARMRISRVALISAHGGNFDCLGRIAEGAEGADEFPSLRVRAYTDFAGYVQTMAQAAQDNGLADLPETDVHAGGLETSQLLYLSPDLVRPFSDVTGYTAGRPGWLETLFSEGVQSLSEMGVLGRPQGASAEVGKAVCEALADLLARWICGEFPDVQGAVPLAVSASAGK